MWVSPQRRAQSFSQVARVSRIQGGWFSTCGSRLGFAHSRFKHLQEFHGLRAGGGRLVFKMRLSL
eukprot:9477517-Pyramimonas_sp.AAC.1